MIRKRGKFWILYDSEGNRVLGRHRSAKKARKQEIAIRLSKLRKQRRIPHYSRKRKTRR
jgi:hypothetical protein